MFANTRVVIYLFNSSNKTVAAIFFDDYCKSRVTNIAVLSHCYPNGVTMRAGYYGGAAYD